LPDGTNKWRLAVPLEDAVNGSGIHGNAFFDVQLLSQAPFPKREDWPK